MYFSDTVENIYGFSEQYGYGHDKKNKFASYSYSFLLLLFLLLLPALSSSYFIVLSLSFCIRSLNVIN